MPTDYDLEKETNNIYVDLEMEVTLKRRSRVSKEDSELWREPHNMNVPLLREEVEPIATVPVFKNEEPIIEHDNMYDWKFMVTEEAKKELLDTRTEDVSPVETTMHAAFFRLALAMERGNSTNGQTLLMYAPWLKPAWLNRIKRDLQGEELRVVVAMNPNKDEFVKELKMEPAFRSLFLASELRLKVEPEFLTRVYERLAIMYSQGLNYRVAKVEPKDVVIREEGPEDLYPEYYQVHEVTKVKVVTRRLAREVLAEHLRKYKAMGHGLPTKKTLELLRNKGREWCADPKWEIDPLKYEVLIVCSIIILSEVPRYGLQAKGIIDALQMTSYDYPLDDK